MAELVAVLLWVSQEVVEEMVVLQPEILMLGATVEVVVLAETAVLVAVDPQVRLMGFLQVILL